MEFGPLTDGDLDRDHLGGEPVLDLRVDPLEVRVLLIHERDKEQALNAPLLAVVPHLFRAHLHAARRRHDHYGAVGGVHARQCFAREVEIARGVDQVELYVHPFGDGEGEVDRVLAFDFVRGVIGKGSAVFHGSVSLARAGHEREGVDQ